MKTLQKVKDNLKYNFVVSTGALIESTPVFAVFETGIAGMSDDISINARLLAAGVSYFGGMGWAYAKGRDLSRNFFKITQQTKEKIQGFHDSAYGATFNLGIAPLFYYIAGSRDIDEIVLGTATSVAFGLVNGTPLGYSIDVFRDLIGSKNCERPSYPNFLKRQSSNVKKSLAALLIAGSIGLTAGVYALTPDKKQDTPVEKPKNIERMVNTSYSTQ